MEVRLVRLNIPELIGEFQVSKCDRDIEGCNEIKESFRRVYESSAPEVQVGMRKFITKYLTAMKLDHKKDLDKMFGDIFY